MLSINKSSALFLDGMISLSEELESFSPYVPKGYFPAADPAWLDPTPPEEPPKKYRKIHWLDVMPALEEGMCEPSLKKRQEKLDPLLRSLWQRRGVANPSTAQINNLYESAIKRLSDFKVRKDRPRIQIHWLFQKDKLEEAIRQPRRAAQNAAIEVVIRSHFPEALRVYPLKLLRIRARTWITRYLK